MRLLICFMILFSKFCHTSNFLIPKALLGTWKPTDSTALFKVSEESIQTIYKDGNLKMNIQNITVINKDTVFISLNKLNIIKIPSEVDVKNFIKAVSIVKDIIQNDLQIKFYNESLIHYKSGKLNGSFVIKKIE